MNALITVGWIIAFGVASLLALLLLSLRHERELKRAPKVLAPGLLVLAILTAALVVDFPHRLFLLSFLELTVLVLVLLFFLPSGSIEGSVIPPDMPRIDERNIMFARAGYRKGEPNYEDYYSRHPEKQVPDDLIRSLPGLCSPGAAIYDPVSSRIIDSGFRFLEHLQPLVECEISSDRQTIDPALVTETVKGLAKYHGAKIAGITETKPYHFYSHRGRHPENYGEEIAQPHKYAIVFAVEMDYWMIKGAPLPQVSIESSKQYIEGAKIGMALSYFIRELGYPARNHMDGNYLLCAPLVAHDAGIGEIGRMGILITEDYGPRVRLGVVTTDLPLIPDTPIAFGVQDTCRLCKKCAQNCPSQAISHGDKAQHDGVVKWKINQERCFEFWCKAGTDCAICMNTCPYSKPDTMIHRLFRFSLRRSQFCRRVMVHLDDYLYGRRPSSKEKPRWL